jgi:hypothetical protein
MSPARTSNDRPCSPASEMIEDGRQGAWYVQKEVLHVAAGTSLGPTHHRHDDIIILSELGQSRPARANRQACGYGGAGCKTAAN